MQRQGRSAGPPPGGQVLLRCVIGSARGLPLKGGFGAADSPGLIVRVSSGASAASTSARQPSSACPEGPLSCAFHEALDLPVPSTAPGVSAHTVAVVLEEEGGLSLDEGFRGQALFDADSGGSGRQWLRLLPRPGNAADTRALRRDGPYGELFVQWSCPGAANGTSEAAAPFAAPQLQPQQSSLVGRGWMPPGGALRACSAPQRPAAPSAACERKHDTAKARVHFNDLWAQSPAQTRKSRSPNQVGPDGQPRDDSAERLPGPGTLRLRVKGVSIAPGMGVPKLRSITLACSFGGVERQSQTTPVPAAAAAAAAAASSAPPPALPPPQQQQQQQPPLELQPAEGAAVEAAVAEAHPITLAGVPFDFETEFDVVYSDAGRKALFFTLWGQAQPSERGYEDVRLGDGAFEVSNVPPPADQSCTLSAGHVVRFAYRVTYQRPLQEGARGRPKSAHPNTKKASRQLPLFGAAQRGAVDALGFPQGGTAVGEQRVGPPRPLSAGKAERLRREVAVGGSVLLGVAPFARGITPPPHAQHFAAPGSCRGDEGGPPFTLGVLGGGIDTGAIEMNFDRPCGGAPPRADPPAPAAVVERAAPEAGAACRADSPAACGPPPLLPPETFAQPAAPGACSGGGCTVGSLSGADSPPPCSPPPLVARSSGSSGVWSPPLPAAQPPQAAPQPPQHPAGPPVSGAALYAVLGQLRRDMQRQLAVVEERLHHRLDTLGARVTRLEQFADPDGSLQLRDRRQDASGVGLPTTMSPPRSRPASCQSRVSTSRPCSGGSARSLSIRCASPTGHLGASISRPSSSGTSTGAGTPPPCVLAADISGAIVSDEQLRAKFDELAAGRSWISREELCRFYRSFDSFGIDESDDQVTKRLSKFSRSEQVPFHEFAHLALYLAKR
eukprot:TRINITY_DN6392_c0_g2_i1.p1 TRINITY_DN6392_c0_g2~~TRINITY_DN6392_c0_g2_i1.p1  ORF type:complete len:897 (+),score=240.40 TRINITY_DN6392_c0_g2_i1:114-2804(+)